MKIQKIYIDEAVSNLPETASFVQGLKSPMETVDSVSRLYERIARADDPVAAGKKVLFLTDNKGPFLKKCPGTSHYTCCNYAILHIGSFCTMDCSYCILQTYFHPPLLQFFLNSGKMFQELDQLFRSRVLQRIGTGEFTDSLIWEPFSDINRKLVRAFAGQSTSVLELKTKTTSIQFLKNLDHNRKTILSWSLNTEAVIQSEERRTAPLSARLKAAASAAACGYPVAFHFDPIVLYEGCERDYQTVIEQIFHHINADQIVWISLGSFRFIPSLKAIVQQRFPDSKIVYGEFVSGMDGKMRYFKPLRTRLFQKMVSWIRRLGPEVMVYLCMEDDSVWKKALGFTPAEHPSGSLSRMLDQSAIKHCRLTGFQYEE